MKKNTRRAATALSILLVINLLSGCSFENTDPFASTTNSTKTTITTSGMTTTTTPDTTITTQTSEFSFTEEQSSTLDSLIQSYGGNVSVAFYDINSGYTYSYNSEHVYFVASIIKAPFCLYILDLAEQNKTNLNHKIKYTDNFYAGGTGRLKDQPFGGYYSVDMLVEYAIRYSDNVALRMLKSHYSTDGFVSYAKNIGVQNINDIKNINNGNITASDALVYMKEIYSFISSGTQNGRKLRTDMLNTSNPMICSKYPVVRKYGWADGAFHDAAIIEAPNPYILVILSDHDDGTTRDFSMFKTISTKIEAFTGQ